MSVFDANPSTGSIGARPLTVSEIDDHPEADRIWATITEIKATASEDASEELDRVRECVKKFADQVEDVIRKIDDAKDQLERELENLDEKLEVSA